MTSIPPRNLSKPIGRLFDLRKSAALIPLLVLLFLLLAPIPEAGAAEAEILFGDAETVVGLAHQSETRAGGFAERVAPEQQADGMLVAAPAYR